MPGGRRRRLASADGHDAVASCARQPQLMTTDQQNAVVDRRARLGRARWSATPAGVLREARNGFVWCSSTTEDGDRQARCHGAQPNVASARAAASTVPNNRRCRRVHRWMRGWDARQLAREALPLVTGRRGGKGREMRASSAAAVPRGTWAGRGGRAVQAREAVPLP